MSTEGERLIQRCTELGVIIPSKFAFVPVNLNVASPDELAFSKLTPDLERVLGQSGYTVEHSTDVAARRYVELRGADWLLPTLLCASSVDLETIRILLRLIGAYVIERMKRLNKTEKVKMSLVHSTEGAYQRLDYEGPVEGLEILGGWQRERGDGHEQQDA